MVRKYATKAIGELREQNEWMWTYYQLNVSDAIVISSEDESELTNQINIQKKTTTPANPSLEISL